MKFVHAALILACAAMVQIACAQELEDVLESALLGAMAEEIDSWRDAEISDWGRDAGAPFFTVTNLAFRDFSYRVYGVSCQPAASLREHRCAGMIFRKKMRHDDRDSGRRFVHEWDRAHPFAGAWISDVDGGLMMRQTVVLEGGVTWGSIRAEARHFHTETMPDFCQAVIDRFRG